MIAARIVEESPRRLFWVFWLPDLASQFRELPSALFNVCRAKPCHLSALLLSTKHMGKARRDCGVKAECANRPAISAEFIDWHPIDALADNNLGVFTVADFTPKDPWPPFPFDGVSGAPAWGYL
jgi:hypothetical protein